MKNPNWDRYQIFLHVARQGGLSAAAAQTDLSPATIGRHMVELERQLGRALFVRSQGGYALTADGRQLAERLSEMEAAARAVEAWRADAAVPALVRIAAGTWNAWLIAENFPAIRNGRDRFRVDLHIAEQRASLSYRENDIGIRAFAPEELNLAAVPAGEVAYAAYQARNLQTVGPGNVLAVGPDDAVSAYLRFPHQKPDSIIVTVNRPRSLRDLALAGAGIAVLPCFVGDLEARLERVGDEIVELRHRQWIVMNNDDRHRKEIRTVADRMIKLFKAHAELFAGKRPNRS